MIIPSDFIVKLYQEYHEELESLHLALRVFDGNRGQDLFESEVAYMMVRKFKPQVILEAGSATGWMTSCLAFAFKNNKSGQLYGVDINSDRIEKANENIRKIMLDNYVSLYCGDASVILPKIANRKKIDLLFFDAVHDRKFAEWYIREMWPLLKKNGWMQAHDIYNFKHGGERDVLRSFLKEKTDLEWLTLHSVVSDQAFIKEIKDIYNIFTVKKEFTASNTALWVKKS